MNILARRSLLKVFAGTPLALLLSGKNPDIETTATDTDENSRWAPPERKVDCRSYHLDRLKYESSKAERIYAELWTERNPYGAGINHGIPTAWFLRGERGNPQHFNTGLFGMGGTEYYPTTIDEERAMAAVVQWLGTNVGLAFMMEAEQRIKRGMKF